MRREATLQNIPDEGYEGGLIFDEMSIQEDFQMARKGNEFELIGMKCNKSFSSKFTVAVFCLLR